MKRDMQIAILRLRYLLSRSFFGDYLRERKLRKLIIQGFTTRRYVRFVSTIELYNFPEGVSDLHAVTADGNVLHPDILFPEYEEDDVAVALLGIKGAKFTNVIGPVPNHLGNSNLLQRVLIYSG